MGAAAGSASTISLTGLCNLPDFSNSVDAFSTGLLSAPVYTTGLATPAYTADFTPTSVNESDFPVWPFEVQHALQDTDAGSAFDDFLLSTESFSMAPTASVSNVPSLPAGQGATENETLPLSMFDDLFMSQSSLPMSLSTSSIRPQPQHHPDYSLPTELTSTSTPDPASTTASRVLRPTNTSRPLIPSPSTSTPAHTRTSASPTASNTAHDDRSASPEDSSISQNARKRKRERNTEAARRYRQRRVDQVDDLQAALNAMTAERDALRAELSGAKAEAALLKEMMRSGDGKKG